MQNCQLSESGTLNITPSQNSSKHDFDFYEGHWKIHNRKLKARLCHSDEWDEFEAKQEMQIILLGLGNTDNLITEVDGVAFEGRTIRLFDPVTKLWSMYWTDSINPVLQPPTIGSFEGDIGKFYCTDIYNGQDIIVEFIWDKSDKENPLWSQAFSIDNGKSWETNWYMSIRRG